MHRPPPDHHIYLHWLAAVLVSQSQSIECIRAVPDWVGIKAIDSPARVGGEHKTKSRIGKVYPQEKVLRIEEEKMVPAVFPFISNVFSTVSSVRETLALEVPWGKGLERRRLKWHYFVTAVGIQKHSSLRMCMYCIVSYFYLYLYIYLYLRL